MQIRWLCDGCECVRVFCLILDAAFEYSSVKSCLFVSVFEILVHVHTEAEPHFLDDG